MKIKRLVIVNSSSGDWQGLYLDDVIAVQGHSIRQQDLVRYLKDGYESVEYYETQGFWLEEEGSLPDLLDDTVEKGLFSLN